MARLADVGYRIGRVAGPLCPAQVGGTGIVLDDLEAYPQGDRAAIGQLLSLREGVVQIAAVAAGSPAARAGVRAGDALLAIDGKAVEGQVQAALAQGKVPPGLVADWLEQSLAAHAPGQPITVQLGREGGGLAVTLVPEAVCSARYLIKAGEGISAFSDSRNVAVSSGLIGFTRNDDELALVVGHEVGHVIARDGKARSLGERRAMEDRADILGTRLAICAGYDLEAGVRYWLRRDAKDWLRWARDPTHRSRKKRAARMRAEAVRVTCPPSASVTVP